MLFRSARGSGARLVWWFGSWRFSLEGLTVEAGVQLLAKNAPTLELEPRPRAVRQGVGCPAGLVVWVLAVLFGRAYDRSWGSCGGRVCFEIVARTVATGWVPGGLLPGWFGGLGLSGSLWKRLRERERVL